MSHRTERICGDANLSIPRVDAGQIDFADELDGWGLVGILVAAVHFQGVDSVLMDALKNSQSAFAYVKGE